MANRFLDTNYYKSSFVRGLKGALKSLYSFIICDCDGAGIWNLDLQAASLYTGFEISELEFKINFIDTGKAISIGGNKFFFPDFIEHQYPNGLQENNPAHRNFIKTLKKNDLLNEDLSIKKKGASKGLKSPLCNILGNGNSLGKVMVEVIQEIEFEKKWNTKPGKDFLEMDLDEVKAGAVKELFKFTKNHHLTNGQLKSMWQVFKAQNFTGAKFYQSPNDVYSHFINWSKTQNINGTHQQISSNGKLGTSEARIAKAKEW